MQTFLPYDDPAKSARILDYKRLGKQRVETIQLLNILLRLTDKKGFSNHPATRMWKGYEPYLVKVYLKAMLVEWSRRGYNNCKSEQHYKRFMCIPYIKNSNPIKPPWITPEFCLSHQSNLVRKKSEYYSQIFDVPDNLNYIWPE